MASRARLDSVDILRGLVMVIMALDHTRDFFSNYSGDPSDLSKVSAGIFLTRWITHFCAPVFVFLAGAGAFLSNKPKPELARFLITRGLWLVFLELTVVRASLCFNLNYQFNFGQVIWVLGWSMIGLAGLIRLPAAVVGGMGVAVIALHNLLDPIRSQSWGSWSWFWIFLHEPNFVKFDSGAVFFIAYSFLPWMGVMAAGYGFGALLRRDDRVQLLTRIGLGATALFVAVRAVNIYGDPTPWSQKQNLLFTFFSFLNCQKYPPSLLYLLMTLGPAILLLAAIDKFHGGPLLPYGRVPMFYYLIHFPLIHLCAVIAAWFQWGRFDFLLNFPLAVPPDLFPAGYGYNLFTVYLIWIAIVSSLYLPCRWFGDLKRRRNDWWLSYL
jgi:uncharacterized membrane protein